MGQGDLAGGHRGLTFHDLRGTAVVTLARAGCNEVEIYSITGHKPGDVQRDPDRALPAARRGGRRQRDRQAEQVQYAQEIKRRTKIPDRAPDHPKIRELKAEKT